MKRSFLLVLFALLSIPPLLAFKTIVPSFIRVDTTAVASAYTFHENIPNGPHKVHFINHITDQPQIELAMETASKIFTAAMTQAGIDLVDITADVSLANLGPNRDILCEVDIVYSDTVRNLSYYPRLSSLVYNTPYLVLVPMVMSNQTRGVNHGVGMYIKLRNDISYHCSPDSASNNSFDAITLLLRALAMGCGVQSTFNDTTANVGIVDNGIHYINAYDAIIYNEDNNALSDIIDGTVSANQFFTGKSVWARGMDEAYFPKAMHLNNIREDSVTAPFSGIKLHEIAMDVYTDDDYDNGLIDLLDPELSFKESIREVTPYTLDLLRGAGWMWDIPVGNNPLGPLYSGTITCNDNVLYPNNTYTVTTTGNGVAYSNMVCELKSTDSTYVIANINPYNKTFSYSTLPSNVQWKRNSVTKNIIGQIKAKASMLVDATYGELTKIYEIEIPYRPNKPLVGRSETSDNNYVYLDLSVFANGSENYTITYTGLTDLVPHSFNVTADAIDTILLLPATQYYDVTVYGTNTNGISDTYTFTAGTSIQPELYLNLVVFGNTLQYSVTSSNPNFPSSPLIGPITITDIMGVPIMYSNASPGDNIDISSLLRRSYYLFSTTINGEVYSKRFYKR